MQSYASSRMSTSVVAKEENMVHTQTSARICRVYLKWLMTNHFASVNLVPEIRTPMLILSGLADELIPSTHSAGIFAAASKCETKQLHTVEHGTHNDTFIRGGMEYYQAIFDFIETTRVQQSIRNGQRQEISISNKV